MDDLSEELAEWKQAASTEAALRREYKALLDEVLVEHELMRRTLETIAANSFDQLQATQARGALVNIGPAVTNG